MGKGDLVAPPVLHKQNQRIDGQPKQILSCWSNICLKNNVVVTQNITLADASLLLFAFLTVSHFLRVTVREAKNMCLQRIFRATVWGVLVSWRLVYTWCDSTLIRSAYKRIADHDFWLDFFSFYFFKKFIFDPEWYFIACIHSLKKPECYCSQ